MHKTNILPVWLDQMSAEEGNNSSQFPTQHFQYRAVDLNWSEAEESFQGINTTFEFT
jgi:hypothetical protein